jgi:hypothetical protein
VKNPILFSTLVILTVGGAGLIEYKFGLPKLTGNTMTCGQFGSEAGLFGCGSGFGEFTTMLAVGVVVVIAILWKLFSDSGSK